MSATLGPIHYRMYAKALEIDGLARSIAAKADRSGWTFGLAAELDSHVKPLAGELAEHIELANIHQSLNDLISNAERALEFACAPLAGHLAELESFAEGIGRARAASLAGPVGLQAAWQAMDASWLDGMPCDRMVQITENASDAVAWSVSLTSHRAFGYARLRSAWMRGFFGALHIEFAESGEGRYRIRKAA